VVESIEGDVLTKENTRRVIVIEGANGGIEYRVKAAPCIAEWLEVKGYIDRNQIWDLNTFMDLRSAYDAFFGVKWGAIRGTNGSGQDAGKLYDGIRREIGLARAETIFPVVISAMMDEAYPMPAIVADQYRKCIDEVTKAVFDICKRKNETNLDA
jgi:hypothetical protein